jgi:ectoine hydrolase
MTLFLKEEYLERTRKTKARMSTAGIDVLVVSDPANMNYLTGYDGWSFYVPQCVVVCLDADTPLWIGRRMDVAGARHTTFLPEPHIIGYPENYIQTADRHPMNFVGDMITERGWGNRRPSAWRWMPITSPPAPMPSCRKTCLTRALPTPT